MHVQLQEAYVKFSGIKQSERIGVVDRIFKQISGGYITGEGGKQGQDTKFHGEFCRLSADQRLQTRSFCIRSLRGFSSTKPLLDAADPVNGIGITGVKNGGLPEPFQCGFRFVQLIVKPAELFVDLGILRPFADQLRQQGLG